MSENTNINDVNTTTVKPAPKSTKKKLSIWTKIKLFFAAVTLITFIIVGSIIYVMINPNSDFAIFAEKYLGFDYVISNKSQDRLNQNTTQSDNTSSTTPTTDANGNKLLNNILGLGNGLEDQNTSKFSDNQITPSTTEEVVEQVLPSVVSISIQAANNSSSVIEPERSSIVEGTGFFVSDEGLIMTNKHIVAQLCTIRSNQVQILATDYQNKAWEASLVSVDPTTDLAILKIKEPNGTKFRKVTFFPSQNIKLGMDVIAIGNALGQLKNTVTTGVVSGTGRNIVAAEVDECGGYSAFSDGLIQTDAAINNGNSGGPLFNKKGDLIGVNTFKGENAQSVGLSIPADDVDRTLKSFLKNGKISKPYLGVLTNNISDTFKKQNPWIPTDYGAMVDTQNTNAVFKDSAAAKAGIKLGDILLSIDGQEIRSTDSNDSPLRRIISKYESGAKVKIMVLKSKLSPIQDESGRITQRIEYDSQPTEIEVTLGSLDSPI